RYRFSEKHARARPEGMLQQYIERDDDWKKSYLALIARPAGCVARGRSPTRGTSNDIRAVGWARAASARVASVMRLASDPRQRISLRSNGCEHRVAMVFGLENVGFRERRRRFHSKAGTRKQRPDAGPAAGDCPPKDVPGGGTFVPPPAHPATMSKGESTMRHLLTTTCLGAAAILSIGAASANDELIKLQQDAKQWVMPTGNYANQRYSQLKQITPENAGKLQVAWTFSTGVLRGHEGGPLVVGNVMYIHAPFPNTVFALDLNSEGKILWKYEPKQDPTVIAVMCCDTVNRGPSYADGKIFLHQADTTLVALDAKSGNVVWSVKNGDPAKGETGTSSPMVFKDKVVVGISGGEFGVRGSVTAYDIKDGKRVWRGYSMGPDS